MKSHKNIFKLILLFFIILFINSCSSVKNCPEKLSEGNFNQPVNSEFNESFPVIFNNNLYFLKKSNVDKNDEFKLYFYNLLNKNLFMYDTSMHLNLLKNISNYTFINNNSGTEIYFAASNKIDNKISSDIFFSKNNNSNWDKPQPLKGKINSTSYESQPTISKDGKLMVFISDRDGTLGKTDLYYSIKENNNEWSEPINLGNNVNTINQEISPFLDENNDLYFSTLSANNGLNIVKSKYLGNFKWDFPVPLPYPINSNKNDLAPFIFDKIIYLASDRDGGCGGYDIYTFPLCKEAILTFDINFGEIEASTNGKIYLYNLNRELLNTLDFDNKITQNFNIQSNQEYILKYENPCFKDFFFEKKFFIPCSDTSIIKVKVVINLPDNLNDFSIEKYDVPFFVSGYYMPNTYENLEDLKLKFEYNLIGNSDSTKYIENPKNNYDGYTYKVDKAIDETVKYINSIIYYFNSNCSENNDKLYITINGYSDPRPISGKAKYIGVDIHDKKLNISVKRGAIMTNELLSLLRAYYTYKLIQEKLKNFDELENVSNRIVWKINGMGINDISDKEFKFLRKVEIDFKLK